jgi:hypothetical protein
MDYTPFLSQIAMQFFGLLCGLFSGALAGLGIILALIN